MTNYNNKNSMYRSVAAMLLNSILSEEYPSRTQLPPERRLAEILGTNRGTLREALRFLERLNLIEVKRGSGITVKDYRREATLDLLPYYMEQRLGSTEFYVTFRMLLDFRRVTGAEAMGLAAKMLRGKKLSEFSEHVRITWECREDTLKYIKMDLEFFRKLLLLSGLYPLVWVYNSIYDVFDRLTSIVAPIIVAPENYVQSHEKLLEFIYSGDEEGAKEHYNRYLAEHDQNLLARIEKLI